jgi:hypothetical protein
MGIGGPFETMTNRGEKVDQEVSGLDLIANRRTLSISYIRPSSDSDSTAFMEQIMVFSYEYAIGDDRD